MIPLLEAAALSDSDRAALQGLIPLASGLGAGTIFALFFSGRRRPGFAVFEIFAIVAVLVAVATTAYFAIALLHQNEAISDRDLTQAATPLIVAGILLVVISVSSRVSGFGSRASLVVLPMTAVAVVGAALLASLTWNSTPDFASLAALLILGAGVVCGLVAWAWDRHDGIRERRELAERFAGFAAAGYVPQSKPLRLGVPTKLKEVGAPAVSVWTREQAAFLDLSAWVRLRDQSTKRWDELTEGKALAPVGRSVLVRVEVKYRLPLIRSHARIRVSTLAAGETEVRELIPNDDGLFDVTGLGIV